MASIANSSSFKHGVPLWYRHHSPPHSSASIGFRTFRRSYVVSSSAFANENRESVIQKFTLFSSNLATGTKFLFDSFSLQVCDCWRWQCGWLRRSDFRRARNGRWTPCYCIQRGNEILELFAQFVWLLLSQCEIEVSDSKPKM